MRIIDLTASMSSARQQAATLLVEGFAEHWPLTWPDIASARLTVEESLLPDRICRAAIAENDLLLGWAATEPMYGGNVWEINVLVVRPDRQRQGIGSALLVDMEHEVAQRGGLTIWLGSDDEDNMTSLAAIDLFPDPLEHLNRIVNFKGHPYEFYRKVGFAIVGVLPDANGLGKPDIFLAKSVARR